MQVKVLYAEDEKQMSAAVCEILRLEGYDVTSVYDGQEALDKIRNGYFDIVILDVMMPVMSGIEVLSAMRSEGIHVPVMMLTAKSTVDDRVTGLVEGADDYLPKPFAMKELLARVQALVRREDDYRRSIIQIGNVVLDRSNGKLTSDAGSLILSSAESEVFAFFSKHIDEAMDASRICEELWGDSGSAEKAELYVFYLRNKLRQVRSNVNFIIADQDCYALTQEINL